MAQAVDILLERKLSAIIRTSSRDTADQAMQGAVDGGFRVVEFTLTTPGALDLVAKYSARSELLVGAGTVMTTAQAKDAVAAGARFIVSPIADPEVIAAGRDLGAATIPGAFTPLEMQRAHAAGADLVKIFPAPHDIVTWITQVRGPLPHLKLFPTAGITEDNFFKALEAGAVGAGFVASLFHPQEVARGDSDAIRARAERIHARLKALAT